jgi:hypothetical protein
MAGFDEKLNGPRKTADMGSALHKDVVDRYIQVVARRDFWFFDLIR